jgi:hypothetical protein
MHGHLGLNHRVLPGGKLSMSHSLGNSSISDLWRQRKPHDLFPTFHIYL